MTLDDRSARYIKIGFITRLLFTGIIFFMPIDYRVKILLIFSMDFIDSWTTKLVAYYFNDVDDPLGLCHTFRYQSYDKWIDVITYFIVAVYFNLSPIYYGLVAIRLVGVLLFYKTLNSRWLIVFPDAFKEMLLYNWFVSDINLYNFNAIYFFKVGFEAYWHTYHNNTHYTKNH
jgi:hypothetical protein